MVTTKLHALLIGIDDYEGQPLSGCVNDIDCVQRFLLHKLGVPPACISRLEAPLTALDREPVPEPRLPTHANLTAALRRLASDAVQPGERVLVYYSGHGSYEKIPRAESYFEGLVPLDHGEAGLLYDVELNQLLGAIARRSGDLTVILDCCNSAGATRQVAPKEAELRVRFLAPDKTARRAQRAATASARLDRLGLLTAGGRDPQDYTVVAACRADEIAAECRFPPKVGPPRGLFSYTLFELLAELDPETLAELRWSDVWEELKSRVTAAQPGQRPLILGPRARRIFGGPFRPQDAGYAVSRAPDGGYKIAAGSLAGLGVGAQLAVYGPEPALFPPLDSPADHRARLGVLAVKEVQPAQAMAEPCPAGAAAFALPAAARGRLIKAGEPELLRVAVGAELDPQVRRLLEKNASTTGFVLLPADHPRAECRIGQYADGDIWIGDELFGPGPPVDLTAPGPMGRIRGAELADAKERAFCVRAALHHYARYVIPLRTYRSGGFSLPEQAVKVRLLDCASEPEPLELELDASRRREARWDGSRCRYVLDDLSQIAIQVQNTLNISLYVFLLLCSLEGRIQLLAENEVLIKGRSGKIFWSEGAIGQPFVFQSMDGHPWGIDRLIILATDQKAMDLEFLKQEQTLEEAIAAALSSKSGVAQPKVPGLLRWTATQTLIQVGGPGADAERS